MQQTLQQNSVDLGRRRPVIAQTDLRYRNMLLHAVEPLVFAVNKGMMDHCARLVRSAHGSPDNVHDRSSLCIGACDGIDGG
jgi:hypothetical protein